jgi:hypothetical protein
MCVCGSRRYVTVTIGDTDLPGHVHRGTVVVEATLGLLFQAFAEDLSEFVGDMEVGVSEEGGPSLPLHCHGRPVHGKGVAVEVLV